MAAKLKVLFFDDDKSVLSAFRRFFRKTDFDAVYISSGDELLAYAVVEKVDLLVSDVNVPGVDIESLLCRFARLCPRSHIIMLSGDPDAPVVRSIMNHIHVRKIIRKNNDSSSLLLEEIGEMVIEKTGNSERTLILDKDIEELIPPFVTDRIEDCREALRYASEGKRAEVRQIAHSLKGAGSMYGFEYISRVGEDIEQIADSADQDILKGKLSGLISYLENIKYRFR